MDFTPSRRGRGRPTRNKEREQLVTFVTFVVVTGMDRVIVGREALCGESALGAINGMLASSSASPIHAGTFHGVPSSHIVHQRHVLYGAG